MFLWNLTIKRNGNENETILRPLLINGQGNHGSFSTAPEFIHSRIICELRVPQNIGVKMGGSVGVVFAQNYGTGHHHCTAIQTYSSDVGLIIEIEWSVPRDDFPVSLSLSLTAKVSSDRISFSIQEQPAIQPIHSFMWRITGNSIRFSILKVVPIVLFCSLVQFAPRRRRVDENQGMDRIPITLTTFSTKRNEQRIDSAHRQLFVKNCK